MGGFSESDAAVTEPFHEFLRIAGRLNEATIVPLLMGSVGMEYVTRRNWHSRDIDIHVPGDPLGWDAPDATRIHDWDLIMTIMSCLQYELVDLHEHEFTDGRHDVEFGVIDTLPEFAGIAVSDVQQLCVDGVRFRLPSAEQYLRIYRRSSQDSYRADNNNRKDLAKITYLRRLVAEGGGHISRID